MPVFSRFVAGLFANTQEKPKNESKNDGRVIIYGDLHGCLRELEILRDKIRPNSSDIEYSIGDIINKGPYSKDLIAYLRDNNIKAILGNHEEKFLRYRFHEKLGKKKNPVLLNNLQEELYKKLDDKDFEFLENLPYFVRLGKLTLIHGGTTNMLKLDEMTKKELQIILHIRWLDKNEHFISLEETKYKGDHFWADVYDGHDGFIVYGHQPFKKPKITRNALGIDTGCVYGNKLTAAIFKHVDQKVEDLSFEIVQVKAQNNYSQIGNLL